MLVFGDSDMYRAEHVVKFYQLLGGGLKDAGWMREHQSQNRLAILPDQTHYDIFFSPRLLAAALPFLDGVKGSKTWDEQLKAGSRAGFRTRIRPRCLRRSARSRPGHTRLPSRRGRADARREAPTRGEGNRPSGA